MIIFPLLVLIIAAGMWLTNTAMPGMSDAEQRAEIRAAVIDLCDELAEDRIRPAAESTARRLKVPPALQEVLGRFLREMVDPDDLQIVVESGDLARPIGDGRASHHAVLRVDDQPRFKLRFLHEGRPGGYRFLGYKRVEDPESPE